MNRYTAFTLFLASVLVLVVVKTISAQGTSGTAAPVTATNQVTTTGVVTPTAPITNTIVVTPAAPAPATSAGQTITGTVVNANILNVRNGPGVTFTQISTLTTGAGVAIVGRDSAGTWLQIRLPAGQTGWVSSQFVRTNFLLTNAPVVSTTATPSTGGAATATVSTDVLNVRSGPGLTFGRFAAITQNQVVSLLGRSADNSWLQVRLADGRTGWVSSQFVTANLVLSNLPIINVQ